MEAKIKIAVLCFDVSDIDIITVNNRLNPLYAFKVATAYFREQGKVPVFEDSNCRLLTYSHS